MKKQTTQKQIRVQTQVRAGDYGVYYLEDCKKRRHPRDVCWCEFEVRRERGLMSPLDNSNEREKCLSTAPKRINCFNGGRC